jgi:hypothetical protein
MYQLLLQKLPQLTMFDVLTSSTAMLRVQQAQLRNLSDSNEKLQEDMKLGFETIFMRFGGFEQAMRGQLEKSD